MNALTGRFESDEDSSDIDIEITFDELAISTENYASKVRRFFSKKHN